MKNRHELPTLFQRPDKLRDPLYVVVPIINATRFRTRWKLFQDFEKHVAEAGAILYVVEVAFGHRDFVVTSPCNPRHIQLRTHHELWLKERAINIGVSRLPADWKYVAWLDPDCHFVRYDWANETLHTLQHYPIIQMWSQLINVTVNYEIQSKLCSFMDMQLNGGATGSCYHDAGGQKFGSPGLAWAARREAWDQMGGLIDYCILGAGDWYFANAMMGTLDKAIQKRNDLTNPFIRKMLEYQEHLMRTRWEERCLVGNVGLMKGLVIHFWHGQRVNRQYGSRGEILVRNGFDPDRDLKPDSTLLWQLSDRSPQLRREIQKYFVSRDEDALS